jgi:hypothetical protein
MLCNLENYVKENRTGRMLSYIFVDGVQLEIGRYELILFGHFEIVGQSGVSPFLNITQDNIRKLAAAHFIYLQNFFWEFCNFILGTVPRFDLIQFAFVLFGQNHDTKACHRSRFLVNDFDYLPNFLGNKIFPYCFYDVRFPFGK